MIKRNTFLAFLFLTVTLSNAQKKEELIDKDYISFVSVFAGMNSSKYESSDILSNSEYGTGFNLGVNYTLFPDYEWQSYFMRIGLEYSKEQTEDNIPTTYQNEPVTVTGNFDAFNLNLFFAYRFNREAKVDVYLGAGGRIQQLLNATGSYLFVREDGTTFPVYQPGNALAPTRYNIEAGSFNIGLIIETGAYFKIRDSFANVSLGFIPSKFMGNNVGSFNLTKRTWFAKVGYQVF